MFSLFVIIELILLIVPIFLAIYAVFYVIGDIKGAPYVPTTGGFVDDILETAKLKKNQIFIELGSGDGRLTREAVKRYQVKGFGYDINPLLIYYSRFLNHLQKVRGAHFYCRDLFNVDLSKADVIFLFLLPRVLKKLQIKLLTECKKGTLIIAHGFPMLSWEKKLIYKKERKLFPTYYYRI